MDPTWHFDEEWGILIVLKYLLRDCLLVVREESNTVEKSDNETGGQILYHK